MPPPIRRKARLDTPPSVSARPAEPALIVSPSLRQLLNGHSALSSQRTGSRVDGVARARACVLLAAAWLAVFGVVVPAAIPASGAQSQNGRVLAVVGRQVGFLNFEAPRPRVLTRLASPSFAIDVAAVATSPLAARATTMPGMPRGVVVTGVHQ
jgi:hypothetical protein